MVLGMRKGKRPLDSKQPMHLVIKCTKRIYDHRAFVDSTLKQTANKFRVPLYDYAIAIDHIHIVTRIPGRAAYVKFIRAVTGWLARKLGTGLIKSVFTRIASWGRDYYNLIVYCRKNREEAFREFDTGVKFRYHRAKPMFRPRTT